MQNSMGWMDGIEERGGDVTFPNSFSAVGEDRCRLLSGWKYGKEISYGIIALEDAERKDFHMPMQSTCKHRGPCMNGMVGTLQNREHPIRHLI